MNEFGTSAYLHSLRLFFGTFNSADGFSSSGPGQLAALLNLQGNCTAWFLPKNSTEKWLAYDYSLLTGSKYFESLLLICIIYKLLNACLFISLVCFHLLFSLFVLLPLGSCSS